MMQIAHAPTGAAVGKYIPNPILAFVAGILIHLLIDKIPHWWPDSVKQRRIIVVIDYFLTAIFIAFLLTTDRVMGNMMWGMAGSLVVDIVLVGMPQVYKSKIGQWHTKRQPHYESPFVFATDVVVILIACYPIFAK